MLLLVAGGEREQVAAVVQVRAQSARGVLTHLLTRVGRREQTDEACQRVGERKHLSGQLHGGVRRVLRGLLPRRAPAGGAPPARQAGPGRRARVPAVSKPSRRVLARRRRSEES